MMIFRSSEKQPLLLRSFDVLMAMKMLLVPEASFCQHVNRQLASGKGHQEAKALSCSSSAWTDFFFRIFKVES